MDIKALYQKVSDQNFRMKRGIENSVNHAQFREQTKNVLLNNTEAIEEALKYAAEAEEKIKLLELELNDAERELDEKDRQIAELTAKKTTSKKKSGAVNE